MISAKFGVIEGGRRDLEDTIRGPKARLLEDEIRWAREQLREKLGRAPTREEVSKHALELAATKYGRQAIEDSGRPDDKFHDSD